MTPVKEIRERLIEDINHLPQEDLLNIDLEIQKIKRKKSISIEDIFEKAASKYDEVLKKLAT